MSTADELKKLAELREAGVLTPEEFDGQKRRLLTGATTEPPAPAPNSVRRGLGQAETPDPSGRNRFRLPYGVRLVLHVVGDFLGWTSARAPKALFYVFVAIITFALFFILGPDIVARLRD